MAIKKINENPTITDVIQIDMLTPDADGCLVANPYKIDSVVIYFVERDFLGSNYGEYEKQLLRNDLANKLAEAKEALCDTYSAETVRNYERTQERVNAAIVTSTISYKDRVAIKAIGTANNPAWLSTDTANSPVTQAEDENGDLIVGQFIYEWHPQGSAREGDYFVCWTYTPYPAGDKLSAHVHFVLEGDGLAVASIPTHVTPEGKYDTLIQMYTPECYKRYLDDDDITPETIRDFNGAVAKGFTFLEDMANQIIDLFDANALHESMLSYLGNLFALKLRSDDSTLWRRQIKEAIPLFKRKGTMGGLDQAFSQAGMTLDSFSQYWQIVSPYYWTESFLVGDAEYFDLEKDSIILPLDSDNAAVWLSLDGGEYEEADLADVEIEVLADGTPRMTWIGGDLATEDRIKLRYQYADLVGSQPEVIEEYIRSLPLMDARDETAQSYPPKNWNVRLIAEDDVMFDVLIPVKHPFADPVVFGFVRTEFGYSENIYNREEYNGSTRPSYDACFIDKSFRDACGACLSSSYKVAVSVENLSNDRMEEARDILREYTPFKSALRTVEFTGEFDEIIQSPEEQLEMLITIDMNHNVLSGNANPFFNRSMEGALSNWIVTRQDLTDQLTVVAGETGTAESQEIVLGSPDHDLKNLGVDVDNHFVKVLSPSVNAGTYQLSSVGRKLSVVGSAVAEPLSATEFTFEITNVLYETTGATVSQADRYEFAVEDVDFGSFGTRSQWDVDHDEDYTGNPWVLYLEDYSATPYTILDVIDGKLILENDGSLPTSDETDVSYELRTDGSTVKSEGEGDLTVVHRGAVDFEDAGLVDRHQIMRIGDLLYYDTVEYEIGSFDEDGRAIILDYEDGAASGATVEVRRRILENAIGYFGYRGFTLTTTIDHEAALGIVNGSNPVAQDDWPDDSLFKENFLFQIGDEFYRIVSIDGTEVVLNGKEQDWTTSANGGTSVEYSIIHFPKNQVDVNFLVFDHLDRDGQDPVVREIFSSVDSSTAITALSTSSTTGLEENVEAGESFTFTIERRDGTITQGVL